MESKTVSSMDIAVVHKLMDLGMWCQIVNFYKNQSSSGDKETMVGVKDWLSFLGNMKVSNNADAFAAGGNLLDKYDDLKANESVNSAKDVSMLALDGSAQGSEEAKDGNSFFWLDVGDDKTKNRFQLTLSSQESDPGSMIETLSSASSERTEDERDGSENQNSSTPSTGASSRRQGKIMCKKCRKSFGKKRHLRRHEYHQHLEEQAQDMYYCLVCYRCYEGALEMAECQSNHPIKFENY